LKSLLRMLLVAGVFVVSLAAVQEEAQAEPMLSSWYGPGLEGNLTALMGCQVADGCLEDIWVVPELAEAGIALITEQAAYLAALVVMVYAQAAFFRSRSSANNAHASLHGKQSIVLFGSKTVAALHRVEAVLSAVRLGVAFFVRLFLRIPARLASCCESIPRNGAFVKLLGRLSLSAAAASLGFGSRSFRLPLESFVVALLKRLEVCRVSIRHILIVGVVGVISSLWFSSPAQAETMVASWYGPGFEGATTASGEVFDPYYDYTAAHPYLPMGTELEVCYVDCTVVRVNDRGPYVAGRDLDLSQAAAEEVGLTAVGTDVVDVEVLE
jgi:rare lipoprotein A